MIIMSIHIHIAKDKRVMMNQSSVTSLAAVVILEMACVKFLVVAVE